MSHEYPNLTPVKHKKEGYTGWIDGITKIEELFTGARDSGWQYRIYLPNGKRKVAPQEDLEHYFGLKGCPPRELLDRYVHAAEGESDLHALGYNLTGLNSEERRKLLVYCAIPMLGCEQVLKSLCDILWRKVRRRQQEKIDRYRNALEQWSNDLDFVLTRESVQTVTLSPELLNYIKAVREHLEEYADIRGNVSSNNT
ncbi:MAG: hypothetical protein AB1650_03140 [Candidatus Omnitrophota bacterium]